MDAKKIDKKSKIANGHYFCLIFLGLVIGVLGGCSRSPCEKYLHQKLVLKRKLLVEKPKPIPNIIRREYDICILQKHNVKIIRLGQTWKLVFPSDDLFDNDTAEINHHYMPILDVAADFLQTYSKISVKVASYSNKVNDDMRTKFGTITEELTTRQAEAVMNYLTTRRINARLIYAVGKGARRPVAWDGSPYGRRLNRRVEVSFRYYRNNTAWY
jgi:outer membrane protein OmpA-like peptidoglycan-associated protein